MNWRDQLEPFVDAALKTFSADSLAVLIAGAMLFAMLLAGLMWRRRRTKEDDGPDAGMSGTYVSHSDLRDLTPDPADRMLPLGRLGFLALVVVVSLACWSTGYTLASDKVKFLQSKEWQFQPFYVAAHLVTLRLFVAVYARNYRQGIAWLNVPADQALASMHRFLGPLGAGLALLIAVPFAASDFRYLHGDRYERLDQSAPIQGIDYVMWGIWCTEWFLNAFIWVILVGFLWRNVRTLTDHQFTAPIERVLQEKHYRPFLRMSSQGASVVLGFGLMTVLYIGYTGGAITDYMGLAITASLLVIGFLVPWSVLRGKVRRSVEMEQGRLHAALGTMSAMTPLVPDGASKAEDLGALTQRLDYAVSLLRLGYLEGLHLKLGATEARALTIRLLAPAVTIAWQLLQNHKPVVEQINRLLQPLLARLGLPLG